MNEFRFFPEQASSVALGVDALYFYLIAITVFFTALIFFLVVFFAVLYRRKPGDEKMPKPIHGNNLLEIVWTLIPLGIVMTIFVWGTYLFFVNMRPPQNASEVFVVGKQWMWKLQHPQGKREINHLHVPVGVPIKLTMTSEDVIHSFYIPAFRVKMDVLPGRYTSTWFKATKTGEYHLFCAEYCGTNHSRMGGKITVMEPGDYQAWLSGASAGESMVARGEKLYRQFNCQTCHGDAARAPNLKGLYSKTVALEGGRTLVADESYMRESILQPNAKMVSGYAPLMPTYAGQMNEEQVLQVVAYLKSLGGSETPLKEVAP